MRRHIDTMMKHFKDTVDEWDVVNEAFLDWYNYKDYRTDSKWYRCTKDGPQKDGTYYIREAFWRAQANAKNLGINPTLYYNDFDIEEMGTPKADFAFQEISRMRRENVPIQGVGFQMHLKRKINLDDVRKNVQRYVNSGFEVSFTEVDTSFLPKADPTWLREQADAYKKLAEICVLISGCKNFITWGVNDASSWIPKYSGQDPKYGDPLLFDNNYNKKPACYAVESVVKT